MIFQSVGLNLGTDMTTSNGYIQFILEILILTTTNNNPDIWLENYNNNNAYFLAILFFCLVMIFGLVIVLQATIADKFNKIYKASDEKLFRVRILGIMTAFSLLDQATPGENQIDLMAFQKFAKSVGMQSKLSYVIFKFFDCDDNQTLDRVEFVNIFDSFFFDIKTSKEYSTHGIGRKFKIVGTLVESVLYERLICAAVGLLFIYSITFHCVGEAVRKQNSVLFLVCYYIFNFFPLTLIVIKFLCLGFRKAFYKEKVLVTLMFLGLLPTLIQLLSFMTSWISDSIKDNITLLAGVANGLMMYRMIFLFNDFTTVFNVMVRVLTIYPRLLGMVFIVIYVYVIIGMSMFAYRTQSKDGVKNPLLAGSDYDQSNYYSISFNDAYTGFISVMCQLIENNWTTWMEAYKLVYSDAASYIYFISFYFIGIMFLKNIFFSIYLEAVQFSAEKKTVLVPIYINYHHRENKIKDENKDDSHVSSSSSLGHISTRITAISGNSKVQKLRADYLTIYYLEFLVNRDANFEDGDPNEMVRMKREMVNNWKEGSLMRGSDEDRFYADYHDTSRGTLKKISSRTRGLRTRATNGHGWKNWFKSHFQTFQEKYAKLLISQDQELSKTINEYSRVIEINKIGGVDDDYAFGENEANDGENVSLSEDEDGDEENGDVKEEERDSIVNGDMRPTSAFELPAAYVSLQTDDNADTDNNVDNDTEGYNPNHNYYNEAVGSDLYLDLDPRIKYFDEDDSDEEEEEERVNLFNEFIDEFTSLNGQLEDIFEILPSLELISQYRVDRFLRRKRKEAVKKDDLKMRSLDPICVDQTCDKKQGTV
eukprot:Pgem_evm1s11485